MELKIEYIDIDKIKPYENNPRHNEEAIPYVMNSIKEFGFKVPIILDKNNVIIAGHTRVESAKRLGMTEVPCLYANDLTEEQVKAFRLADNKVSEKAEWDFNMLDAELADLDIDMSEFGFDKMDLNIDDYGTEFNLKEGDREPIITMSITLSDEQAEKINEAISKMKQTELYKNYEDEYNKNSNGNALYLVVLEWLKQKI
jgi:ParB-like chromosome segregation protein Spo0J